MEFKKFFSSTSDDIRVASTSGHAATITKEGVIIPDILWPMAYSLGAISEDMKVPVIASYVEEKKREAMEAKAIERQTIKNVLIKAKENPVVNFNADGTPSARKIMALYGSPVKKDLIDEIWEEIVKEGI